MSVYISKEHFLFLPFTIYVQDERSGYYQVIAVAKRCHYFLKETSAFIILTVSARSCFVKKQKHATGLTVVIMAPADRGTLEVAHSMHLMCQREIKEPRMYSFPEISRPFFCNKNGFNITIPRNATAPPLNLDAIRITSDQSQSCKPQKKSTDAITFTFPFTDCGTQSMIADGNITYWIDVEVKQQPHKGGILRETPFRLTVRCSFTLTQKTQLGIQVQQSKSEYPSTLKNKGTLRTEMRFAKDSSYRSFHSFSDPPTVTELGQPVYVEVFVVKSEDKDLVLLLEDCWATPTNDPHDPQRWNLLVKGCPFGDDSHRTVVLPVASKDIIYPSLHKWFVVRLFSFVKPPSFETLVYFHCNIEICKGPDCSQSCTNGKRKLRRISPGTEKTFSDVVSGGPLLYLL
ncbi:zona pellucida sperm-binding protein 4-like [Xenentodon cancila]